MKHLVLYGIVCILCLIPYNTIHAQKQTDSPSLENYTVRWTSQSKNSSESMPCGGGDTGLNVWVENNDILFYFSRSGTFDENNAFLKLGRIRLRLSPNPLQQSVLSKHSRCRMVVYGLKEREQRLPAG